LAGTLREGGRWSTLHMGIFVRDLMSGYSNWACFQGSGLRCERVPGAGGSRTSRLGLSKYEPGDYTTIAPRSGAI